MRRVLRSSALHTALRTRIPTRTFTVLAFESSADDSCVAIVRSDDRKILANVVIKQDKLNESLGGIHPYLAIDQHQQNLPVALRRALDDAQMSVQDVDGIAFTRGPGMGGCLSVSMNAAKALAAAYKKPLVGVHHMQAHALTPLLTLDTRRVPQFPFLTLLLSGGHTLLLLARSRTEFTTIATTLDESIGIALDKAARIMGLAPSGAALEQFAEEPRHALPPIAPSGIPIPRQLAFSFAGLGAQLKKRVQAVDTRFGARVQTWTPLPHYPGAHAGPPPPPPEAAQLSEEHKRELRELAWIFQSECFAHIEEKVGLALRWCKTEAHENITALVVSGGVASNMFLRKRLEGTLVQHRARIPLVCPPPQLCTDNAAMIAWASMHRFLAGDHDDFTIKLRPKWALDDLEKELATEVQAEDRA